MRPPSRCTPPACIKPINRLNARTHERMNA
jgi:hypothetical protein